MAELRKKGEYWYQSMKALLADEPQKNYSFDILTSDRSQRCAILAPHGGEIEWGTDQIAKAIAAADYRLFAFDGHREGGDNLYYLHVKSEQYENAATRLEENVSCLAVIESCDFVLAIHGAKDWRPNEQKIYIGGRNEPLKINIFNELEAIHKALTFEIAYLTDRQGLAQVKPAIEGKLSADVTLADINSNSTYRDYAGLHEHNICNNRKSHKGAQLEISKSLRCHMVPRQKSWERGADFHTFVNAVRKAINTSQVSERNDSRS